jgi:biopolymer transport protein ExbB/TolQ
MSIYSWNIIIKNVISISKQKRMVRALEQELHSNKSTNRIYYHARSIKGSIAAELLVAGIDSIKAYNRKTSKSYSLQSYVKDSMKLISNKASLLIEKHISILLAIGAIAPLVGIFGIISSALHSIQTTNVLSIALLLTMLSILTTIPAFLSCIALQHSTKSFFNDLKRFSNKFILSIEELIE